MFVFRHGARSAAQAMPARSSRHLASRIAIPFAPPPFPVIDSCPAPTCKCRQTPPELDIDREQNLNGTMASYASQVLVSTGRNDWTSRIEEDEDATLVKQLKSFLGRDGKYSDPFNNVLLTNSSFQPTESPPTHSDRPTPTTPAASAFLLPSFQYIPSIPTEPSGVEAFIKAFVLPQTLHQSHDRLTRAEQNVLLRQPEAQRQFVGARKIHEILVLICGHGGRDDRCGKLGPILQAEFEEKLQRQNVPLFKDAPVAEAVEVNTAVEGYFPAARVGLISHIGGHKFAGNVIVYMPRSFASNPLAGKGIWYGRVGPEHVEGIVEKTILQGKVIKDQFRGGIDQDGSILRL